MDLKQWEIILAQSFEDSRLSDSEKEAINQWIAPHRTDEQALTLLRASLFQFAREHAGSPDQTKLIEWLGKIVKLLLPLTQKEDHDPVVLFAPEDGVAERIAGLFHDAKETVSVCVFTITDNFLTDAILAAHNRGVLIRVLTDNQKSSDDGSDIHLWRRRGSKSSATGPRHICTTSLPYLTALFWPMAAIIGPEVLENSIKKT